MRTSGPLAWAAIALLAAGCSRQESAWRESRSQDNAAAYEAYLEDYPAGTHAAAAQARLAELREQQEWDRALRFDTPEAYQRYLTGYPSGRYAVAARERLSEFLLAREPETTGPTEPGVTPRVSGGTPIVAARAAGDFVLQLGAFTAGEAAARLAWSRLQERHGDLLAGLTPRVEVIERDGRSLWRLRAGPLSEVRGRQVCESLESRGAACLVLRD